MAVLLGHMEIWNASLKMMSEQIRSSCEKTSFAEATILSICYISLSITTVLGNTLVIVAVVKDPLKTLKSSPTTYILLEMAIADFCVGLVFAPSFAMLIIFFEQKTVWYTLFLVTIFGHYFVIVSAYHVLLLTIDRYFALAKPLKYRTIITKKRVLLGSSAIWILCCSSAALCLTVGEGSLLIPLLILATSIFLSSEGISLVYAVTLANLVSYYKKRMKDAENSPSNQLILYQREKKVFLVIFSVILAFCICYFPWVVVQLIFLFCLSCHANYRAVMVSRHVAILLLFVNSSLNPLLYSWRFSKFQTTFKYLWRKHCCQKTFQRRKIVDIRKRRQNCNTRL
ncbi:adenosine receptor A1-like [Montipora foliosa]|uniref:adenosine receptor A1-like n=1 Tax=Montipora foliosa TaxID=591990 RepID=UPI0035F10A59